MPAKPVVLVATPSIDFDRNVVSSTYTPGDRYSGIRWSPVDQAGSWMVTVLSRPRGTGAANGPNGVPGHGARPVRTGSVDGSSVAMAVCTGRSQSGSTTLSSTSAGSAVTAGGTVRVSSTGSGSTGIVPAPAGLPRIRTNSPRSSPCAQPRSSKVSRATTRTQRTGCTSPSAPGRTTRPRSTVDPLLG